MSKYPCDPNVELNGNTVQAFLTSLTHENYQHILKQHGFKNIDPDQWYPLQDVLDTLEAIETQGSGMMDLVAIGMAAANLSVIPPEIEAGPPHQFFKLYEQLYPTRHRNGDPGSITTEVHDEHHVTLTLNVPYPDDMMYGLFYGFARRLSGPGNYFTTRYDEDHPRRELGGDRTIIHIEWD